MSELTDLLSDIEAATFFSPEVLAHATHYLAETQTGSRFAIKLPLLTNTGYVRRQLHHCARDAGRTITTRLSPDGTTIYVLVKSDQNPAKRA